MNVSWKGWVLSEYWYEIVETDFLSLDVSTLFFHAKIFPSQLVWTITRWSRRPWRGHRRREGMRKSTESLWFLLNEFYKDSPKRVSSFPSFGTCLHCFFHGSSVVSSWRVPHLPTSLDADCLSGDGGRPTRQPCVSWLFWICSTSVIRE